MAEDYAQGTPEHRGQAEEASPEAAEKEVEHRDGHRVIFRERDVSRSLFLALLYLSMRGPLPYAPASL